MSLLEPQQQRLADIFVKLAPIVATVTSEGHVMPMVWCTERGVNFTTVFTREGDQAFADRELHRLKERVVAAGIPAADVIGGTKLIARGSEMMVMIDADVDEDESVEEGEAA